MAIAAEEHGREILEVYLQAMRGGDWESRGGSHESHLR
jgi:hypothetical protein